MSGPSMRVADALRVLVLELQAHLLGLDRGQELREVVGVDPEPELRPVVVAGDLLDRLAQVGVGGRDHHLVGRELEPHGARPVAGQERDALDRLGRAALRSKSDLLVVVLGDHPLVVGEGPLEDAADQLAPAEAEREVVLAAAVGELAVALEALQLLQRLARHQDRVLSLAVALEAALRRAPGGGRRSPPSRARRP